MAAGFHRWRGGREMRERGRSALNIDSGVVGGWGVLTLRIDEAAPFTQLHVSELSHDTSRTHA